MMKPIVTPFSFNSSASIRDYLRTKNLRLSKKFGQNFMIDAHMRERFIHAAELEEDQYAWEIGPGIGALTHMAIPLVESLRAFELDYGFCAVLKEIFRDIPSFELIEGDVLKNWSTVKAEEGIPDRVFGNLPYNIGAVFIASLIEEGVIPEKMVFTLQRETALRMTAVPGDKIYSSYSLISQLDYDIEKIMDIDKQCFFPVPEVTSSMVVMHRRERGAISLQERRIFFPLVKSLFASRRKTIKNNLQRSSIAAEYGLDNIKALFLKHQISLGDRAETVPLETYIDIVKDIQALKES
ncbi:MAG: 16S rRNA (adenine(1518)-N(6)/adenine(1519)-N(6))-dimethyltransferase RsmA [Spirochaetia bacterium]|nr:16S rRNA (adenine(1518)-N(6)/adenine(1519)-N(6))-dimethyltransferase RsmA [Spirochaetia bacterium]